MWFGAWNQAYWQAGKGLWLGYRSEQRL
ncbi:hypothetical protein PSEUDO8O_30524 [Pseudomonas sp. 8O]|nr:hypothetical protein PSEUDO8O_30524 [Pseudomonas sp. 8O]